MLDYIVSLDQIGMEDLERVGGKNASLGEMIRHLSTTGVDVPGGFATTVDAYRRFLEQDRLGERIEERLAGLDVNNLGELTLVGKDIRKWLIETPLPPPLERAVELGYEEMC